MSQIEGAPLGREFVVLDLILPPDASLGRDTVSGRLYTGWRL